MSNPDPRAEAAVRAVDVDLAHVWVIAESINDGSQRAYELQIDRNAWKTRAEDWKDVVSANLETITTLRGELDRAKQDALNEAADAYDALLSRPWGQKASQWLRARAARSVSTGPAPDQASWENFPNAAVCVPCVEAANGGAPCPLPNHGPGGLAAPTQPEDGNE